MPTATEPTTKKAQADKLQALLDQWKAEVHKLEAKARESRADARIEVMENVDSAKQRWESAKRNLDEFKASSGDAWKELKGGTEAAFESLQEAVHRAQAHFSADRKR